MAPVLGGIEAGGTRWRCAVGAGPGDLCAYATIATTTPADTLASAVAFFEREGPVDALGAGSFGPVDLKRGGITTTPKPGWADTDVAGELVRRLGVPVAFDTDVNAAVLGEHRWGAAQGFDTCCYITVGTGIGGGAIVGGRLLHGLVHPELGHIRIPHDRTADPFRGACPYHGDCWEGLASGAALEARWGRPPETIEDVAAWALEARYLALGLVAVIAVLSPERIVLGGGVMSRAGLLELVREDVDRLLSGYVAAAEIVPSAVGRARRDRPGRLGLLGVRRANGSATASARNGHFACTCATSRPSLRRRTP